MIIKATRVPTRGAALKKLIEHVENADDNDEVVTLRGNTADLLDARQDARSFGRQYCVRHWIVAPSKEVSFEKMLEAVDALASEFGFNAARAVVRGHRKPKAASPRLFDGHIHILVPEIVDPIGGSVLSSAHDWLRGEKVGKILSFDWQEPFVESTKPTPILAALRRDGRADVATAYQAAFPTRGPRPVASFDTADQQRLKRAGLDLPALRLLIAGALDGATNRREVDTNLLAHGLVCKEGEKTGVYMIETIGGEKVGSLSRLAKMKKAILLNLMEPSRARYAEETDYGRGNVPQHAGTAENARTDQDPCRSGAGNAASEPTWDDVDDHRAIAGDGASDDREAGRNYQLVGSAVDQDSDRRHAERLRSAQDLHLTLGLVPHAARLHLMLAKANRLALSPEERAVVQLGEIEDEARSARATIGAPPPEHPRLLAARTAQTDASRLVSTRETELEGACAVVMVLQQSRPWWRRAVGVFTDGNFRRAQETRAAIALQAKAQAALVAARRGKSDADSELTREVQSHRDAVSQHVERWMKEAQTAEQRAAAIPRAHELLKLLPGSIRLGAAGLCEIAAKLMPLQGEQYTEADDYTAVPSAGQP